MKITINIDEDILKAAKQIAKRQKKSLNQVISELARRGLSPSLVNTERNGVPLIHIRENHQPVTLDIVNELRD